MGIWSDVDIRKSIEEGSISIEPKPQEIGPISVDLTVDEIFKAISVPNAYEIHRRTGSHSHSHYPIYFKMSGKLHSVDDTWFLQRRAWCLVKYREKIKFNKKIGFNVTMRSTAARKGLSSLMPILEKGYIFQPISPYIATRIKKGDKISQLVLLDQGTEYLSAADFMALKTDDFAYVDDGIRRKPSLIFSEKESTEKDIQSNENVAAASLHLHPQVKYFKDDNSKLGKPYDSRLFVDLDLDNEKPPSKDGIHTKFFILGRSEEKILIGQNYVGILEEYAPSPPRKPENWGDAFVQYVNMKNHLQKTGDLDHFHGASIHNSAPYILPGSEGYVTFEIAQGSAIQPDMFIQLLLAPVKTPGKKYDNKIHRNGSMYIP